MPIKSEQASPSSTSPSTEPNDTNDTVVKHKRYTPERVFTVLNSALEALDGDIPMWLKPVKRWSDIPYTTGYRATALNGDCGIVAALLEFPSEDPSKGSACRVLAVMVDCHAWEIRGVVNHIEYWDFSYLHTDPDTGAAIWLYGARHKTMSFSLRLCRQLFGAL